MTQANSIRVPRSAHKSRGIFARMRAMTQIARQRAHLHGLSDDQLRDIGHTRTEAEAEANRAPWDAPQHWKR